MRVETDRSRNEYRDYHERKYDDRLKRRNYRNDDYHSRKNGNHSSRSSRPDYRSNYSSSSRPDRQMNNHDIYPTLSNEQVILSSGPPPAASYYNSPQPIRDRGLSSHYIDSERNRYSTYRRDSSPYRNDSYVHDEYHSPTPPPIDLYNDMYRTASDYPNRSERYDIGSNRNGLSREYSMTSPIYRSDPYRTSSVIPMPSSPPPSLSSSSSSAARDQYAQTLLPSMREVDYRPRDYGMTVSVDHRQINSNNSSDRYHDDYHSTSSYRGRMNLKRSRSNFNENGFKRPMRR